MAREEGSILQSARAAFNRLLWDVDLTTAPRWRAALVRALRIAYAVLRELTGEQLALQAMSLVYTTLLSLVPLLAVSFSVLKAFGVHNQIAPLLLSYLAPLGQQGAEITGRIIEFVDNIKAGVLGSLGLALLFYTVLSLLQKVEHALNDIWRIKQHRTFHQRFSEYLSVIVVGPVLLFSALGLIASMMASDVIHRLSLMPGVGTAVEVVGWALPHLLIICTFWFVYVFMPHTRVRPRSAFLGALVAGVLWPLTGWLFASFIVASSSYTAIYSAFATLIMFMIWLYLSWMILLTGASVAFYHQHPEYVLSHRRTQPLGNRLRERLALHAIARIARHYYQNLPACTAEGLVLALGVPKESVLTVLRALERAGLLIRTADQPPAYVPGRPPETTGLDEVIAAVRSGEGEEAGYGGEPTASDLEAERVMARLDDAIRTALRDHTLRDLALAGREDRAAMIETK